MSCYTLRCTCRLWQCVTSHPVLYLQAVAVCYITPCVVFVGCGSVPDGGTEDCIRPSGTILLGACPA